MKKFLSTKNMSREEWLRCRKMGIGGSDAGAICGLNPYSSPMQIYCDKITDEIEEEDNEAMRQGRDLEQYVAERFTEETGKKVRRSFAMYQHETYPFLLANVDRLVAGEHAGLECKTVSPYSADKWKDGEIPPHYLIQCLHYMLVTGADAWYLAALVYGREFICHRIERDEAVIQNLLTVEIEFWNQHVIPRIMPEPDGSEASEELIKRYFPSANRGSIPLPNAFDKRLMRRAEILELMDKLEQEQKQIEQEVKLFMGEHELAENDRYRVSWGNVESFRVDSKRLKQEKPEIYQSFLKSSSYRKLLIKAA